MIDVGNTSSSPCAPSVAPTVETKLNDHVYLLHNPEHPQVELVFIHGLQVSGDFKDAYWKTWRVRETKDCWPATWLKNRTLQARILSLSYDSSAMRSRTRGEVDLYNIGESLLPLMLSAGIGQNKCPVVFVCHSLGGLVAKQIVVLAEKTPDPNRKTKDFLSNVRGFFFYATPHSGSKLVEYADNVLVQKFCDRGLVLEYLRVLDKKTAMLNNDFEQAHRQEFEDWKLFIIGESHDTKLAPRWCKRVVSEASARLEGVDYMSVGEDHINVCKPREPTNNSFVKLVDFIADCIEDELQLGEIVDLR